MTRRRVLLIALGVAPFAPPAVFAQPKKPPIVIGWLAIGTSEQGVRYRDTFRNELAALGWRSGSQAVIEERFADGHPERLPALAAELAIKKPALIVAQSTGSAQAAVKAAPQTPVVALAGDLVSAGLAASHARPGGMVTGISNVQPELSEKYLELLIQAAPKLRRVGFLFNSASGSLLQHKENMRRAVARYAIEAHAAEVARAEEIEPTLKRLAKEGIQALVVMSIVGPLSIERKHVLRFALEQRWPVIGGTAWAADGALLSYGAEVSSMSRRAAYFAARILKGAKPAELPIERPMTFELVLNMKTAKALGLTLPPEIMVPATRVIE